MAEAIPQYEASVTWKLLAADYLLGRKHPHSVQSIWASVALWYSGWVSDSKIGSESILGWCWGGLNCVISICENSAWHGWKKLVPRGRDPAAKSFAPSCLCVLLENAFLCKMSVFVHVDKNMSHANGSEQCLMSGILICYAGWFSIGNPRLRDWWMHVYY